MEQVGGSSFERDTEQLIQLVLETVREHLAADAVYLGEFGEHHEEIRAAVGDAAGFGLEAGTRIPLDHSISGRMLAGRVGNVIGDVAGEPELADLRWVETIGSFVGHPVYADGGQVVGMVCVANEAPRPDLDLGHIRFVEVITALVAARLESSAIRGRTRERLRQRLRGILDSGLRSVFQPIVDLRRGNVEGVEALTRFPDGQERSPQLWFAEAHALGLGLDLEAAAVRCALAQRHEIPDGVYLSLNVSPALVGSGRIPELLPDVELTTIVLEITEHASIGDYGRLREVLAPIRERGIRLAIDDAGAGFSSFRHILELHPEIIKLDVHLTRDIRRDDMRRALTRALSSFGGSTELDIVAEGVEHVAVADELRRSGVGFAQGHLFAPAGPLPIRHLDYPIVVSHPDERVLERR